MADNLAIVGAHHFVVTALDEATSGTIAAVAVDDVVKVLAYTYVSVDRYIDEQSLPSRWNKAI